MSTVPSPAPSNSALPPAATHRLAGFLNDARLRAFLAGAVGGLAGWLVAETLIGGPARLFQTLFFGSFVGIGIASALAASEGVVIGSWPLIKRGCIIGLVVGSMGGAIGAAFGQLTYALSAPSGIRSSAANETGSFMRPTFSKEVADRIQREGGEAGEIEIALIWHNRNDLDLHVMDPTGEEIFFGHSRSLSGGWLDIDMNADCDKPTDKPIEHIRWTDKQVPQGEFRVYVNHYANCGAADPTRFRLEIKNGNEFKSIEETISRGNRAKLVYSFDRGVASRSAIKTGPIAGLISTMGVLMGWIFFGVIVGCAEGLTRKSLMSVRNAAIGGAIGGLLGGIALLIMTAITAALSFVVGSVGGAGSHSGWFGRMLGFTILGACIGVFIVIVKRTLSAVLAFRSGRYEGREVFLDRAEMRIGRNDSLEVYIGGDPEIQSHHATIVQEKDAHAMIAAGGSLFVNDTAVARALLNDGDRITLGKTRFVYKRKGIGKANTAGTVADYQSTAPGQPATPIKRAAPSRTPPPPPPPPPRKKT